MHWARAQHTCGARAASSLCSTSSAASGGKPMVPDAHEVVQAAVNGLRATCSISMQHPVAMGWSTDLASAPTCTVEEPMRTSQHRRQTGCRSSPVCRCGSCTPSGTLQLMCPAASEPLSSRARPLEAWRARGRPRQPPWLVRRSSSRARAAGPAAKMRGFGGFGGRGPQVENEKEGRCTTREP